MMDVITIALLLMMMLLIAIGHRRCGRREHRGHVGFFSRIFFVCVTKKCARFEHFDPKGNVSIFRRF